MVSIIVAMDPNLGIGKAGGISWSYNDDMRHFKHTTTGHVVIMGRKTYESLSGPLRNRINVILSKNKEIHADVLVRNDFDCIKEMQGSYPDKEIFVIGGGEIYEKVLGLDVVDRLIITRIPELYDCDTFFPIEPKVGDGWEKVGHVLLSESPVLMVEYFERC